MKKAQWLKKPSHFDEYMLHTVKYNSCGREAVFFTSGEEGSVELSAAVEDTVELSFVFFHTPQDTIHFKGKSINLSWRGLKSTCYAGEAVTKLKMEKKGETITFISREEEILKITNPAFKSSSSLGIVTEGEGAVTLSVW